jgi:hypothetical protein
MNFIYDLHRTVMSQNLILVYGGDFTQETTKSILALAEHNLDSSGENSAIKRRVFNIMVEALQNIVKHGSDQGTLAGPLVSKGAIFMISKNDNGYCVLTGNSIPKGDVARLTGNLNDLNSKDKDSLNEMRKETMKNTQLSEKGGAGLGFVDMKRKSGKKLEFAFSDKDAEYDFFCLKVNVSREKD